MAHHAPLTEWHVRECFTFHPLYVPGSKTDSRPAEVWANAKEIVGPDGVTVVKGDKVKVFCTPCLDYYVGEIIRAEESDHMAGRIPAIRTNVEIRRHLFNLPKDPRSTETQWMENRTNTMTQHARRCPRQSAEVNARANRDHSPKKHRADIAVPGAFAMHPPIPNPFPALFLQQHGAVVPAGSSVLHNAFVSGAPMPILESPFDTFQTGSSSFATPYAPHFQYNVVNAAGQAPSLASVSALSRTASHAGSSIYPSSHASSSRRAGAKKGARLASERSFADLRETNSLAVRQATFNTQIVRLTASAGLPLNWVTNPELHKLVQMLDPDIVIPGRKPLTQTLLPAFLKDVRAFTKAKAYNRLLTMQCDGWSGINNNHLVAFMATTTDDVFTLKVYDTTTERKTAENLYKQMEEQLLSLRAEYEALATAVATDASGESLAARRMLGEKYPELVVPDCFAHQAMGDYFRADDAAFLAYAAMANELITWLRSKTAILGLIREELVSRRMKAMSVIRPVPTRWTAYYLAYTRLLVLRTTLVNITEDDARKPAVERLILQPSHDRSTREKAQKMIDLINDSLLWHSLQRIKRHLEPLAIAANVTQAAHCRLDEVGMTIAKLYLEYSTKLQESDAGVQAALLGSLEKRWKKCDQDVIIAAIILNPYIKTAPFKATSPWAVPAGMKVLLGRLWKRFYKEDPPNQLFIDLREYIKPTIMDGTFMLLNAACVHNRNEAAAQGRSLNPVDDYNDVCNHSIPEAERPPLWRLAMHIFSVCPNSASCERLFSSFGLILTKLRSRLGNSTLVDLAEAKMHIRDEHRASAAAKSNIRTRAFGNKKQRLDPSNTATPDPDEAPASPANLIPPAGYSALDSPMDDPPSAASDIDDHVDLSASSTSNRSTQALRTLTTSLSRLSQIDDLDTDAQDRLRPAPPPGSSSLFGIVDRKVLIKDLFNFTSSYWEEYEQRTGRISLDEEMELYELLDLDAHGDPDLDPDLDDTVASVFNM